MLRNNSKRSGVGQKTNALAAYTILDAIKDPDLFQSHLSGKSFRNWRIFLRVLFGLKLGPKSRKVFEKHTQRKHPPSDVREAWMIIGRRGGKSFISALCAVYLSCFRDYSPFLGPGEKATIMVICVDRRQARTVMRYVTGLLESTPLLEKLIQTKRKESITLMTRVVIEIHTCSFRSVRGYSVAACICDELAFWRDEFSASPDQEVLNAVRPSMSNIPGSLLLCISSPYARKGELWRAYDKHFGTENDNILIWQSDTRSMNPTIPQSEVDRALQEDEAAASSEYLGRFRSDIEGYATLEAIEKITIPSRLELLPNSNTRYVAFVDPSGGSRDSMTLGIAHREQGKAVLDLVRESKPPFSPESVVKEFTQILKRYRIRVVTGDKWGGDFVREPFRKRGVAYRLSDLSKSEIYQNFLPLINSNRVELLDNTRLRQQLLSLERRTRSGGKDSIDHPVGLYYHDDVINAAAGAIVSVARASRMSHSYTWPDRRDSKRKSKEVVHVTKWGQLDWLDSDRAFTMNCYFCGEELRSYEKHPGKILPDETCQMTNVSGEETWFVQCRGCFTRMQKEPPRKLQAEGRRRRENSLQIALREGRVKVSKFNLIGGQQ